MEKNYETAGYGLSAGGWMKYSGKEGIASLDTLRHEWQIPGAGTVTRLNREEVEVPWQEKR